jgi:hypothetical protein
MINKTISMPHRQAPDFRDLSLLKELGDIGILYFGPLN